ncbi:hypothetical protein FSP39_013560 [Pinctada imbricata]|uniref:non-specific serine/threonine protein kinase n=1 Tax=Pinctada imbricata TaxID=66713 RepID=A0AA89CAQ9_PINIB|nr:hypothetical protein FSP39_013560 [Pinctada imbricata]
MKSYKHENIVAYKESFIDGHHLYIAMEFCEGGSLYECMLSRRDGLNEEEFTNFLMQIMQGVKFLHKNGVIHRDLKTKNILLTKERTIKIADFGVARSIDSNDSTGNYSKFVGTVHYMSPEMISENPKYNEKTDIWSMGCTCYEMATGKYAFEGKNLPRIKQSVLKGELHDLNKMKLCDEMKQTMLSMLSTVPNARPSASDVLEFLSTHTCQNTETDQSPTVPKSLLCENIPGSPVFVPNVRQGPLGRSLHEDNSSSTNVPPDSSRRQSPRDRRRIRLSGVPSDAPEISGASSVSRRGELLGQGNSINFSEMKIAVTVTRQS